jgi:TonB family protein
MKRVYVWLTGAGLLAGCGQGGAIEGPALLDAEAPVFEYPAELWDRDLEGEVVLLVHVTPAGAVDSAYVHETSGFFAFDSAALAGVGELRFAPGRRGTRSVGMWARLPVRFSRDGAQPGALR